MNFRLFISLVGVFLLSAGVALAQESKETKETKKTKDAPPKSIEGYIPVQIRPFSVPVASPGGGLGRGTISMFVIVRGQKNVAIFCRYLPRVREALTLTVDRSPVPIAQNKYQLKDVGKRLHQAINRVLPSPLIVKLHLLPTGWPIGKGAVDLELPGTNSHCMGIRELPAEVLAMLEADNKNKKTLSIAERAPRSTRSKRSATLTPKPASRPVRPSYKPPSVMVKARKTDIPTEETPDPASCRNLNEIWSAGFHQVSGRQYWLGQAFTLDDDNDEIVDNVGFVLRSEDRPDLYIYYFPGQGRQSVITVPSLRIANDRQVRTACAGQEEFAKPNGAAPRKMAGAESGKGGNGGNGDKGSQSLFNGPGLIFAIATGVGVLLIVLAGVYFILSRRKPESRRRKRRARKERRIQTRRQHQEPREEEDRRKTEDRREPPERRDEINRRKEAAEEPDPPDKG